MTTECIVIGGGGGGVKKGILGVYGGVLID